MDTNKSKHDFPPDWKEGVYQAISRRRDIRAQFRPDPIPDDVLARILKAAHQAPSVGYMQPWDFILVRNVETRMKIHKGFSKAHEHAAELFDESRRERYRSFKLEGILESALNICITCDRSRFGPVVVGRTSQPVMDLYSSVCAVQNLWLAARAEGIGVGWVSIISVSDLKKILQLPDKVVPVAYLCLGYVTEFPEKPELESAGWLPKVPLSDVMHLEGWGNSLGDDWPSLLEECKQERL